MGVEIDQSGKIEDTAKDTVIACANSEKRAVLVFHNKPLHELYFARIGNRPAAHYAAKDVFDGKKEADHTLTFEEILRVVRATKKDRWAFKSVSFNAGRRSASVYKRSLSQSPIKVKR